MGSYLVLDTKVVPSRVCDLGKEREIRSRSKASLSDITNRVNRKLSMWYYGVVPADLLLAGAGQVYRFFFTPLLHQREGKEKRLDQGHAVFICFFFGALTNNMTTFWLRIGASHDRG